MQRPLFTILILAMLGFAVGAAAALLVGAQALALLVPALAIGIATLLARRLLSRRLQPLVPAVGLQLGYAAWLFQGVLTLRSATSLLLDVLPLVAGVAWLIVRPGRPAAAFLAVVHLANSLLLLTRLNGQPLNDTETVLWFILHLALRAGSVLLTLQGVQTVTRRARRISRGQTVQSD